jgi:hypothetical protein
VEIPEELIKSRELQGFCVRIRIKTVRKSNSSRKFAENYRD